MSSDTPNSQSAPGKGYSKSKKTVHDPLRGLWKYPSTPHLPWSPGLQNDDRRIETLADLEGQEVVVTEKMDGENASFYRDHYHARSLDSRYHTSRDYARAEHGRIRWMIPQGWRVCGEYLYARHSIGYDSLPAYVQVFSIWDEHNVSRPWDEVEVLSRELGLPTVPVLWRGQWDEGALRELAASLDTRRQEGYVVRIAGEILYDEFPLRMAKWVRQGHVQTDEHWMHQAVVPNGLQGKREGR